MASQPEPAVEANVHAEGIPGLQADVTASQYRVFVIMVKVEAFALFDHGLEPRRSRQPRTVKARQGSTEPSIAMKPAPSHPKPP